MDKTSFRRARQALDLSIAECAALLGVSDASITYWQQGRYRVPGWVADQLREMREVQSASRAERDVRRGIEDRFESVVPKLYLGEVPDGWLALVEQLLGDVEAALPPHLRNGRLSLDFKEKWGSLRSSMFLDAEGFEGSDLDAAEAAWNAIERLTDEAEQQSERRCARCGSEDRVDFTRSGWRLPLCRRHRLMQEGEL